MKNFLHRRNVDLAEAACRIARSGAMTLDEIASRLQSAEAPSYYVSRDYAYSVLCRMRRRGLGNVRPMIRARWEAFDADVRRYMQRRPSVSLLEAVDYVAHEKRAPSFFLEKQSLVRMLQYMNRRQRLVSRRDLLGVNPQGVKYIRHSPRRCA